MIIKTIEELQVKRADYMSVSAMYYHAEVIGDNEFYEVNFKGTFLKTYRIPKTPENLELLTKIMMLVELDQAIILEIESIKANVLWKISLVDLSESINKND